MATETGRTAVERPGRVAKARSIDEPGRGRGTPEKRQMPFARHMSLHILMGEGSSSTDTAGAITNLLAAFEAWKIDSDNDNFTVQELSFEFVTEEKLVLYIIYSE